MSRNSLSAWSLLLPLACVEQTWDAVVDPHLPHGTSTSSGSTTAVPTTQVDEDPADPIQTVTSSPDFTSTTAAETTTSSTATTDGPAENEPPTVELVAEPDQLSEAGKSDLKITVSDDVVEVRLYQNDELLVVTTPDKFPYAYEALSAKYNFHHHFSVEVEDAEGLTASDDAWVDVLLPESGTERCSFAELNAQSSSIAGVAYAEDAIVAVGWRDTGAGQRMAIWKLDKATCELQGGWPKTLTNWTEDAALANATSRAVGVAIDSNGYLAVAANLWPGGKPQPYVALLTPQGARIWERPGDIGEESAGIAVDEQDDVFVVGSRRTSEIPLLTDAMIWGYRRFDDSIIVWENSLKAPFTPDESDPDASNKLIERARAIAAHEGDVFVVGDREFVENNDIKIYTRSFVARYHTYGGIAEPPWTSPGNYLAHDSMNAISRCGEALIAGGWSRDDAQNAAPFPLMRWIEPDEASGLHGEPLPSTQTFGIACDREEKVVSAGTQWAGEFNAHVFASDDVKQPPHIYDKGGPGQDMMLALDCEATTGFCAAGGARSQSDSYAWLRVYHP